LSSKKEHLALASSLSMLLPQPVAAHVSLSAMRSPPPVAAHGAIERRTLLPLVAAALATQGLLRPALAEGSLPLSPFTDAKHGVSFGIPTGWEPNESEIQGGRTLIAASDPKDVDFNVFIAYTPIRGDYSSLGSFGTVDYVATTMIPQCNLRSCTLESDGIQGKLLESTSLKSSYVYEYTIEQTGSPTRLLRTLVSVEAKDGRGDALVTLTAQCTQDRAAECRPTMKKIIESFKMTVA